MQPIQELKSLPKKDLMEELEVAKKEMFKIRIGVRSRNLKDSSSAGKQKKYIARIKTTLREIELEEAVKNADKI